MSEPENFLERWSRRKRAAEDAAEGAEQIDSTGELPPAADAETEPAFDPASLPPLESITAETDIRPFLGPGVPAELATAALRRLWTADPKIRDFVGLADYAWDYHATGTPGFGPLEMTDELRTFVAKSLTAVPESANEPASERASDVTPPPAAQLPANKEAPSNVDNITSTTEDATALQHESARSGAPSLMIRAHGTALPK
jgi:hypothetical protein